MTYGAKFTHGTRSFDLNSAEFDLFRDFSFPAADEALNIGSGTSGNRSGGKVVSKRPQDRWWAWSVRVLGTSKAQTHMAAQRLSAWLQQALEDTSSKVYFEYRQNADIPEPVWGQHGAAYRWEVKAAIVDMDGNYYTAEIPVNAIILPISLLVAPYALGMKQLLAQAKGAIIEDKVGTPGGNSRGTTISVAPTNKMTNPVFEHATWDTGWTAGADLSAARSTDSEYVLWGTASAKLIRISSGSANKFTQSIASGATTTHVLTAYLKKQNGGAMSSSDAVLYYDGNALTTTFVSRGDGWYQLMASVTSIATATTTGVSILTRNIPIYLAGIQFIAGGTHRGFLYGDMLGYTWTGTAHESTSSGTTGYIRLPTADILGVGGGSISLAIRHQADFDRPTDGYLFSDGKLRATYNQASNVYAFTDDTNVIGTAGTAQTFAAGQIDILHFTWGTAGLAMYLNGVLYDSVASLTSWTVGTYLYIGSTSTPDTHFDGTFLDFTIWDRQLTATQIAADYADISPHINGGNGHGQRLSSIPWLWTKDGDNVVDNYTDATHNHYAIAGGIPGTVEAETEINGVPGTEFSGLNLSNFATRRYFSPDVFFNDLSGTAVADSVGGEANVASITTAAVQFTGGDTISWTKSAYPELSETQFFLLARLKDASASYIRIQPYVSSSGYVINTNQDFSRPYYTDTTYKLFRSNLGVTQKNYTGYDTDTLSVNLYGYRSSGTANITADYFALFPRPYLYCYGYAMTKFKLIGNTLVKVTGGTTIGLVKVLSITGEIIEFLPNHYNILQTLMGYELENPALTFTVTYEIYCTPRYALI